MTVTVRTPVELDLVALFLEPPPSHPFNDQLLADRLDALCDQARPAASRVTSLSFLPPHDYSPRWGLEWQIDAKYDSRRAGKRDTREQFLAARPPQGPGRARLDAPGPADEAETRAGRVRPTDRRPQGVRVTRRRGVGRVHAAVQGPVLRPRRGNLPGVGGSLHQLPGRRLPVPQVGRPAPRRPPATIPRPRRALPTTPRCGPATPHGLPQ